MNDFEAAFPPHVIADLTASLEAAEQDVMIEESFAAIAFYQWVKQQGQDLAQRRGIAPSDVLHIMFIGTAKDFASIAEACCAYMQDSPDPELEDDLIELALHIGELAHDLLTQRGLDTHTGLPPEDNA